jgi:hypothetical protein
MIDHPLLAAMPPCSDESYRRIKRSVDLYGLRQRIPVYRGQKLDGRALDRACDELGIPESERYAEISTQTLIEEELANYIMSGKLDREHWTRGQINVAIYERLLWDRALQERAHARERAGVPNPSTNWYQGAEWGRAVDVAIKRYGGGKGGATTIYRIQKIHAADPDMYEEVKAGRSVNSAYLDLVRRHLLPPARPSAARMVGRRPGTSVRLPAAGDDVPAYMRLIDADLAFHIAQGMVTPELLAQPLLDPQPDREGLEELFTIRDCYDQAAQIVQYDLGIIDAPVIVETEDPQPVLPTPRRQLDVEWVGQQQAYAAGETETVEEMAARILALGADASPIVLALYKLVDVLDAVLMEVVRGGGPAP